MSKKVYIAISADILHHGHINLINKASEYGELIVGVLTDEAVASYKRYPILSYEERIGIISNIKGVQQVVPQTSIDYVENLEKFRPDYVVHGDDWIDSIQSKVRARVIETLALWCGELIEIPYTQGVSIDKLNTVIQQEGVMPELRRKRLQQLLKLKSIVRVMEAHNGLSGLVVEHTKVVKDEKIVSFDAMWLSSLTDSTAKGKPDIELVDMTSRINTINEIMEVTSKPIILDGDTGGQIEHFVYNIKTLERMGVSAIIIEDKIGLKKNSLFGTEVIQTQDTIEHFSEKIRAGRQALQTDEFMIIARIESLILRQGMEDAVARAKAYIEAGAQGIMIHSREKSPDEIFKFCEIYKEFGKQIPLIVVPTSFNQVYENEFIEHGVDIVIYANQLIRSAYPAMRETAELILTNERCYEADKKCMPIKEILNLIPGGN
jgi:phosphoenolpyruvate phosphomutase